LTPERGALDGLVVVPGPIVFGSATDNLSAFSARLTR
jgi:hypothetical protein